MAAQARVLMIRDRVIQFRVAPWMHGQTRARHPWYYTDVSVSSFWSDVQGNSTYEMFTTPHGLGHLECGYEFCRSV